MLVADCGSNSCRYATERRGMRTNGHCRCDECPACGRQIRPPYEPQHAHQSWCPRQEWIPAHHRSPLADSEDC